MVAFVKVTNSIITFDTIYLFQYNNLNDRIRRLSMGLGGIGMCDLSDLHVSIRESFQGGIHDDSPLFPGGKSRYFGWSHDPNGLTRLERGKSGPNLGKPMMLLVVIQQDMLRDGMLFVLKIRLDPWLA
jgi:hypothetical protein